MSLTGDVSRPYRGAAGDRRQSLIKEGRRQMQGWQARRARRRDDNKPLALPVDAAAEIRLPATDGAQGPIIAFPPRPRFLILVERRNFVRGCLACWLGSFGGEFPTLAVSDVKASLNEDALARAAAVLVGASVPGQSDEWLSHQIEWLRTKCPNLPIVMIVDDVAADQTRPAPALWGVQGYIPTSSSVDVAAAALRLVVVGGRYFPATWDQGRAPGCGALTELTSRELAVLSVLGQGAPNKIIAFQLGISLSTVKAHVHSIIRKLNVHNRTEAAAFARSGHAAPHTPYEALSRAVTSPPDDSPAAIVPGLANEARVWS